MADAGATRLSMPGKPDRVDHRSERQSPLHDPKLRSSGPEILRPIQSFLHFARSRLPTAMQGAFFEQWAWPAAPVSVTLRSVTNTEVVEMLNLTDFGDMLRPLSVGQRATLPYSTYELFFPPGEPDDGARIRAFEFARSYGCEIDNQPSAGQVSFVKRITNPTPRAVILIIADCVDPISG